MNQIESTVLGSSTSATLRQYVEQSARRHEGRDAATLADDRVEISELATFLSQLVDLPDDRARKIIDIRSAISRGDYLTADKLDVATERLLQDL